MSNNIELVRSAEDLISRKKISEAILVIQEMEIGQLRIKLLHKLLGVVKGTKESEKRDQLLLTIGQLGGGTFLAEIAPLLSKPNLRESLGAILSLRIRGYAT